MDNTSEFLSKRIVLIFCGLLIGIGMLLVVRQISKAQSCSGSNCNTQTNLAPSNIDWRLYPLEVVDSYADYALQSLILKNFDTGEVNLKPLSTRSIYVRIPATQTPSMITFEIDQGTNAWNISASQSTTGMNGTYTFVDQVDFFTPYSLSEFRLHKLDIPANASERWIRVDFQNKNSTNNKFIDFSLYKLATDNTNDYWVLAGASIEQQSVKNFIFRKLVKSTYGYDPVIFNRGISGQTISQLVTSIDSILADNPNARYVAVNIGGNDVANTRPYMNTSVATRAALESNLRTVINKIKQAGKIPVMSNTSYRDYAETQHGLYPEFGAFPYNFFIYNKVVKEEVPDFYDFTTDRPMLDLYTLILNNQQYLVADGTHLDIFSGRDTWNYAWAIMAGKRVYQGQAPAVTQPLVFGDALGRANSAVTTAESAPTAANVELATILANVLPDSSEKQGLLDRLAAIGSASPSPSPIPTASPSPSSVPTPTPGVSPSPSASPTLTQQVSIDFGGVSYKMTGNWNNMNATATGSALTNIINTQGANTGWALQLLNGFNGTNSNGELTGIYPTNAMRDSFVVGQVNGLYFDQSSIKFTGLNPAKSYTFRMFASRDGASSLRRTVYSIGAQSSVLDASDNVSSVADIVNVVPNASGEVTLTIAREITNNSSAFGYIGIVEIFEY